MYNKGHLDTFYRSQKATTRKQYPFPTIVMKLWKQDLATIHHYIYKHFFFFNQKKTQLWILDAKSEILQILFLLPIGYSHNRFMGI